jgi:hypothetical protein
MELYFWHVWPNFGLLSTIIWDRDSRFLKKFWKTIWVLLGFHLKFCTTFHPQKDGQTEVLNRVLVHALRTSFGHNKQWDNYLHILQYSYNKEQILVQDFHLLKSYWGSNQHLQSKSHSLGLLKVPSIKTVTTLSKTVSPTNCTIPHYSNRTT